jgi:hypothetical protein
MYRVTFLLKLALKCCYDLKKKLFKRFDISALYNLTMPFDKTEVRTTSGGNVEAEQNTRERLFPRYQAIRKVLVLFLRRRPGR